MRQLAFVLVPAALLAQDTESAQDVLARHLAWRRTEAARTDVACIVATGTVVSAAGNGTRRIAITGDGRIREDSDLDGEANARGRDATGLWVASAGSTLSWSPTEGESWVERQQSHWFAAYAPETLQRATISDETIAGIDGAGVVIPLPHAGSMTLFVAANGELLASKTRYIGVDRVARYSDWRLVAGIRMPFREDVIGAVDGTLVWDSMEARDSVDDATLRRPETTTRCRFDGGATTAHVPLQTGARGHWFVDITVGGRKARALVDTGGSETMLDSKLAEELGMTRGAARSHQLIDEKVTRHLGSRVMLEVGSARWSAQPSIYDSGFFSDRIGSQVEAVLGGDVLGTFALTIDPDAGTLTLSDPDRLAVPANAIVVPAFASGRGHPVAQAVVEDLPAAWFFVDTGSPPPLLLFSTYVESAQLLVKRTVRDNQGDADVKIGFVALLRLGSSVQRGLRTAFCSGREGSNAMTEYAGILGSGALRSFRVTFDMRNGRLILEQPGPSKWK